MSELKVNKISPQSGTAFTLGDSGDTFTVPSGATLTVAGTFTQTGAQTFDGGVDIDNFNINGTTIALSSGDMTLDVTGKIQSWTIISDQEGRIQFDIKKVDYDNFPNFSSICGSERPTLGNISSGAEERINRNTTISTWNTALNAGDILQFEIVYALNIQRCVVSLKLAL